MQINPGEPLQDGDLIYLGADGKHYKWLPTSKKPCIGTYTSNAIPMGAQGPQGYNGIDGVQGTQGTNGIDGLQGAQGAQGTDGVQGVQGATASANGYAPIVIDCCGRRNTTWDDNAKLTYTTTKTTATLPIGTIDSTTFFKSWIINTDNLVTITSTNQIQINQAGKYKISYTPALYTTSYVSCDYYVSLNNLPISSLYRYATYTTAPNIAIVDAQAGDLITCQIAGKASSGTATVYLCCSTTNNINNSNGYYQDNAYQCYMQVLIERLS